jgi:hypothetical protein
VTSIAKQVRDTYARRKRTENFIDCLIGLIMALNPYGITTIERARKLKVMTQKPTQSTQSAVKTKAKELWRALVDLVVLAVLLVGTSFGGYYFGIHEKLAPVQNVPPGTAGALPPPIEPKPAEKPSQTSTAAKGSGGGQDTPNGKVKYWIASSGADYTGNSITVKVNDTPVDNFFGPGKIVDISRYVKSGDNTVVFDAKALGDGYNKHAGDAKARLVVQVVSGPSVRDDFKASDVLLSYSRDATQNADGSDSLHFTGD